MHTRSLFVLSALALFGPVPWVQAAPDRSWTRDEANRCFVQAARLHNVSPVMLHAIARQESGMNPLAQRLNTDGSVDHGLMQINSRWLPQLARHHIDAARLMQPCVNVHVGAWILAKALHAHGDTWRGLGAYHSGTEAHNRHYAWAIYRRMVQDDR